MTNPIEIVASWDNNPLETTLHTQPQALKIGPTDACWFTLPEALLPTDHELVIPQNGGWLLVAPEGAEVRVAKHGETVEHQGAHVELTAGTTAEVRVGDFAFYVRPTAAVKAPAPRGRRNYGWMRWLAVAAILHGLVLGLFALTPPNVAALNAGDRPDATRYIDMSLDAFATRDEPAPTPAPSPDPAGSNSDAAGELGGGDSDVVAESSSPGPVRNDGARQPRRTAIFVPNAENVNDLGVLASIRAMSWGDGSSPFTAGNDRDGEGGLANAAALLLPRGPAFGPLDMNSAGHGTCDPSVRDCTSGMQGVGPLDTHGDEGDGFVPGLRRRRPPAGPDWHEGHGVVYRGSLSREDVRRTVRRHRNEVRFCYEQSLQTRPDLEGRVAISFIITPDGVVQSSTVASDDTGNQRMASCVQSAVRRWTFPTADGVTGVTYPFVFQSSN